MDIKVLNKTDNELDFVVKGIAPVRANTIRRLIINEVPTMAIGEINFIKNSSAMYDEFIAHRLGLIVLATDLKSYNLADKCKCKGKGCALCRTHLTLSTKGPCTVYASEFKSKDPKVKPIHPNTPIVKLTKKQALEIEAAAVLGRGKDHMKFSPGLVYYQNAPEIKIGNVENPEEVANSCPTKVFKVESKKIEVMDKLKCNLCKACVDASKNAIEVKSVPDEFIFHIESWGQLKAEEMLKEALNVFEEKLEEFKRLLKRIK